MTGSFMGSPNFMSPEQVAGKRVTKKTDVFSAGLVMYMCATGESAFSGETINHVFHAIEACQPVPVFIKNKKVLPCITEIIDKCLQKEPDERPTTEECCTLVENFCRQEKLTVARDRVVRFLENQHESIISEEEELFNHFRNKAKINFQKRNKAVAIRELAIAAYFGTLNAAEIKMLSNADKRIKIRKKIVWGLCFIVLFIAGIAYYKTESLQIHKRGKQDPSIVSHTVINKDAVRSSPDTLKLIDQNRKIKLELDIVSKISQTATGKKTVLKQSKQNKPAIMETHLDSISTSDTDKPHLSKGNSIVFIKTNPPWTKISVDGIFVGEYPTISFAVVSAGAHTISVQKEGFQKFENSFECKNNDTIEQRIRLTPNSSSTGEILGAH